MDVPGDRAARRCVDWSIGHSGGFEPYPSCADTGKNSIVRNEDIDLQEKMRVPCGELYKRIFECVIFIIFY